MSIWKQTNHKTNVVVGIVACSVGLAGGTLLACLVLGYSSVDTDRTWTIPVHATATQGVDNFILATGGLDKDAETVFFLDGATGKLQGAVLNVRTGKFQGEYTADVMQDLQEAAGQPVKNPRFLMVTGRVLLQQQARPAPFAESVVYVLELSTGICIPYTAEYPRGRITFKDYEKKLLRLQPFDFRKVKIRGEGQFSGAAD